jgi:hypothetical protein
VKKDANLKIRRCHERKIKDTGLKACDYKGCATFTMCVSPLSRCGRLMAAKAGYFLHQVFEARE